VCCANLCLSTTEIADSVRGGARPASSVVVVAVGPGAVAAGGQSFGAGPFRERSGDAPG